MYLNVHTGNGHFPFNDNHFQSVIHSRSVPFFSHTQLLDAMKRTFAQCPQIQQCYYVAGEWDFVLVMTVRNMDQYTELTRQLFFSNNNVKRFKTLVSMSRVKVGLGVPVDIVDE
ncbi:Leucine-responsive regulatory protein (plasmid) [Paraburkholderia caribensis MBA4]|uniref:Leucine-responsive regulatory protein n=1 Tax=Paraburkholderia caribensis MBA4 TaxID=1323664 RepID=A0A0P0RR87_9BURK|nr:Leucine-responsive regulatory protein [Paraburkholderia caribensis MBA4]